MIDVRKLEAMLDQGHDSALLRFGLGKHYLDVREPVRAAHQLDRCVEMEPGYSAAWKLLGKARHGLGDLEAARQAWEQGVLAAKRNGDVQAEKEMGVFLRRLARTPTP
ncbi:Chaperone protein YscY (Yop proteins translocation protein Y) [plant metagenome]|uniref:Chaperone protein YscY (Yop proteins translocation protein Y) n=1 Tax=plant metagenome TaxID=1297885 RepID=A0A484SZG4_9ZZZZ